jgi:hypothetical protein
MRRPLRTLVPALLAALVLLIPLAASPAAARDKGGEKPGRWLKIRIYEGGARTPTVLVNVPIKVVSAFVRLAAAGAEPRSRDAREAADRAESGRHRVTLNGVTVEDIDVVALWNAIESMEPGQLVEIQDDEDRVSIWIE